MKRIFKYGFIALIGVLVCGLLYKVVTKIQHKQEVKEQLQTMPTFSFNNVFNHQLFVNKQLNYKEATIFFYFNTTCNYCQHEAEMVQQNLALFQNTNLVFVSNEEETVIKEFAKNYQLSNIHNVIFLQDKQDVFATNFDATSIPYVLIYNKNNQLVKAHKGQIKPNTIVELLQL